MILYLEKGLKFLLNIICLGRKVQTKKLQTKEKESMSFSYNWKYSESDLQNHFFFFFLILGLIQKKIIYQIVTDLTFPLRTNSALHRRADAQAVSIWWLNEVWFISDPVMRD